MINCLSYFWAKLINKLLLCEGIWQWSLWPKQDTLIYLHIRKHLKVPEKKKKEEALTTQNTHMRKGRKAHKNPLKKIHTFIFLL